MTDPDLVEKKLAEIETYVRELRDLADPKKLHTDVREERFVAHTLQLAIQAALDVASHIVSDDRLGEPQTYRDLFTHLARNGWIPEELERPLRDMAGFRNVLVHGYARVDLRIVEEILDERLGDLTKFSDAIRSRLAEELKDLMGSAGIDLDIPKSRRLPADDS